MTSSEIRQAFLTFFESKGHKIVPSAPIVVKNDPTLMFTNAGMNQFKDWFLGNETPKYTRVADTQKCLRVSGKHNDLEEVGVDTYHHTMFEMLGNWSFGDYFKKEAIEWAWELLTEVYKLDKDRLYVTVFEGDSKENLPMDQDAYNEWKKWIAEDRILKGNKKDNFWEMGDTGPCGPCTEIHIDLRPNHERSAKNGADLVNNDHPQVIEIWNNVFMEFNRKADGSLEKLPAQHVDTGMGFERLVRAIEGKNSNYDTDVFLASISFIEKESGMAYTQSDSITDIAMRVMADHIRAIAFTIADGQLPSNNGAGYVIRRILRRAVRYYFQFLSIHQPVLDKLTYIIADSFKEVFPELYAQKDFVAKVIREEEISFLRTLENGLKRLDQIIAQLDSKIIPGKWAFELNDTYGFPIDLTALIAREKGLSVDESGFKAALDEQKDRSRKAAEVNTDDWIELIEYYEIPPFIGYDTLSAEVKIVRYRQMKAKGKTSYQLVFNQTPFYPEGGGQVGDTGVIENIHEKIEIIQTLKENSLILHIVNQLPEHLTGTFQAQVDSDKRHLSENNHSATHLLHAALRRILGSHVHQKGSLVTPDYLRFDFSHFAALTKDEIRSIESLVQTKIRENIQLNEQRDLPIEEAEKAGAMMLFGEKYGEKVRMITFDNSYSRELCGGTHVQSTGKIGNFVIISESAIAAGVRRIEAITSEKADAFLYEKWDTLEKISEILKSNEPLNAIKNLQDQKSDLLKKLEQFEIAETARVKMDLISKIRKQDHFHFLIEQISIPNADQLKNISFQLKNEMENIVCVLGAIIDGKPMLSIIISDKLQQEKSWHAGKIVKEAAALMKGGGGGQPFYASAGGSNPEALPAALLKAKELLGL